MATIRQTATQSIFRLTKIISIRMENFKGVERREILADGNLIRDGKIHSIEIEFDFQQLSFGNFAPDAFITAQKEEIKNLRKELIKIPARIDELSLKKFNTSGDEEFLKAEIDRTNAELKSAAEKVQSIQKNISERDKTRNELFRVKNLIGKLETEIERLKIKFEQAEKNRSEMREDYINFFVQKLECVRHAGRIYRLKNLTRRKSRNLRK